MGTEIRERRLAAIGARIRVAGRGAPEIDVRSEVRFAGRGHAVDLEVVDVERGGRHLSLLARDREGVRQGEWVFVPALGVNPPLTLVLFDEPLFRGPGKSHVMQFAYRRGGRVAWVNRRQPSDDDYSQMIRDPEVFAKGAIRHADHPTVVLRGWHRVAMNTEQSARAMRHVAFLD